MSFERATRVHIRTRPNLRRTAGKCCRYCGVEMIKGRDLSSRPTRDHIVPLGRGGLNVVANIEIICYECNQNKGMLLPDEFIAWREGRASRLDKGTRGDYMTELPINMRGARMSSLGIPEIVVTSRDVVICGTHVARPESIAPSQWLGFWTKVVGKDGY